MAKDSLSLVSVTIHLLLKQVDGAEMSGMGHAPLSCDKRVALQLCKEEVWPAPRDGLLRCRHRRND